MGVEGFARNLKMKENLDLSVEQAESYRDKFFELYPGLSKMASRLLAASRDHTSSGGDSHARLSASANKERHRLQ